MSPSSSRSRFSSLRQAVNGRSLSASARTSCLLLGVLCLVFFLAEMNESNSVVSPASSTSSAATPAGAGGGGGGGDSGAKVEVKNGDRQAEEKAATTAATESFPGGLRRFGSFEEYVVSKAIVSVFYCSCRVSASYHTSVFSTIVGRAQTYAAYICANK